MSEINIGPVLILISIILVLVYLIFNKTRNNTYWRIEHFHPTAGNRETTNTIMYRIKGSIAASNSGFYQFVYKNKKVYLPIINTVIIETSKKSYDENTIGD